jgi:roadblock/LC7 domain-containing protein
MLQERAAERGVKMAGTFSDPKDLGKVLTDLHKKPGQLRDMVGRPNVSSPQVQASGSSAITDMLSSPLAKAVLAGIAAMVVKRVMGGSSRL